MMKTDDSASEIVLRFFQQGGALRMLFAKDVSTELDVLQRYARQLANAGEYGAAARIFKVLTIYDAWSFEYWFELGTCCQADTAWSDAIYAYGRAAKIKVSEAQVPCAAGECYLASGNLPLAAKAFRAALLICGMEDQGDNHENRKVADIRRRARAGLSKTGEDYESDAN
ncbi:pathogenicity island 2 chaperone protein SscA [Leclercia adecarboxylata]|nr:pathogenicity island 2 chaperone protein SscA [Leclercia adecarboxylata]KMN61127.1 pathogenicity island 2 chaperone protein SscA [Leclercia sp. LK8]